MVEVGLHAKLEMQRTNLQRRMKLSTTTMDKVVDDKGRSRRSYSGGRRSWTSGRVSLCWFLLLGWVRAWGVIRVSDISWFGRTSLHTQSNLGSKSTPFGSDTL